MNIGWIGMGRMGLAMALRLLQAGHPLQIWNRTRSKAQSLVPHGAVLVERRSQLRGVDVLFVMLATGKDLQEVLFGADGVLEGNAQGGGAVVDCSTIGVEESAEIRELLAAHGVQYLAAPVSGNPKCVAAGKLSCIVSGPRASFDRIAPLLKVFAARGVSYAGEGELARICKIAHNVLLATITENLIEVTLLAQKAGVPRHAFLQFINDSVLGSVFTRYKSPALVNLDFTPTFTIELLRKDIDLGLDAAHRLQVAMPVTAAVREVVQGHIGAASLQPEPPAYHGRDFAAMLETLAWQSGVTLEPEDVAVPTGLEESSP